VAWSDDPYDVDGRAQRVRRRRAWLLLGLTAVLPGSAQLAHGSKGLGRLGLRIWLTLILLVVLLGVAFLVVRDQLITVLTQKYVMLGLAAVIAVVAAIGLIILLNTWWLARPYQLGGARLAIFSALTAAMAAVLSWGAVTAVQALTAGGEVIENVFGGGGDTEAKEGRYNILLLGADSGADREGLRPDSITVASVDIATGRTVLFSLPRNLEGARFAPSSPLYNLFPNGFDECEEENCMLNAVYLLGVEHANLFTDTSIDPGVQAMIDAVSGTLGLEINYYAMVNMAGFQALIDAVGGINLILANDTDIGIIDDWQVEHIIKTLPAGENHLNGEDALLYARSRIQGNNEVIGNDFVRMSRQKCVMSAMLAQLSPMSVASNFTSLAGAADNLLETSVPQSEISELASLALKARALPIISVSFTPPLVYPGSPNFALIRQTVQATIAEAEALDAQPTPDPNATTAEATEPAAPPADPATQEDPATAEPDPMDTNPPTEIDDLAAECQVG
jgi:LCP family protein required for cell wall assembly